MGWHLSFQLSYMQTAGFLSYHVDTVNRLLKMFYSLCFYLYEWSHRYIACWYYIIKNYISFGTFTPKNPGWSHPKIDRNYHEEVSHKPRKRGKRSSWWCGVGNIDGRLEKNIQFSGKFWLMFVCETTPIDSPRILDLVIGKMDGWHALNVWEQRLDLR